MVELVAKPALSSRFQAERIMLTPLPEGHVVHVLGRPGSDLMPAITAAIDPLRSAVRASGPGQWLIVGDAVLAAEQYSALETVLSPHAFLVDQSHGRIRVSLSGVAAIAVLSKGTAVDAAGLEVGQTAMTMINHLSVHLTRTGEDDFELIVLRGFAEDLWQSLVAMAAEYA